MASQNIQVAVRCRPLSSREASRGSEEVVKVNDAAKTIHVPTERDGKNSWTFDHVYAPGAAQADLRVRRADASLMNRDDAAAAT